MTQAVSEFVRPDDLALAPSNTILEAAQRMRDNGVTEIYLTSGDELRGAVTEHDIVRAIAEGRPPHSALSSIQTSDALPVETSQSAHEVAGLMRERRRGRLPVARAGKLLGVVALPDLATATAGPRAKESLQDVSGPTMDDGRLP